VANETDFGNVPGNLRNSRFYPTMLAILAIFGERRRKESTYYWQSSALAIFEKGRRLPTLPVSRCRVSNVKSIDTSAFVQVGEILAYLQTDRYLDKSRAANYLGVGLRTFEGWMDHFPKYRPGGKALFRKSELDAFMKRHQELPNMVDVETLADEAVRKVLG
jgi:excisionase family DNA binding protein